MKNARKGALLGLWPVLLGAAGCLFEYSNDCDRNVDLDCFWQGPGGVGPCGDGVVDNGEACDDGNTDDCDGCRGDCKAVETGCGDGSVCGAEECDDGNAEAGDGCFECQNECKVAGLPSDSNFQVYTDPDSFHCYVRIANPRISWGAARNECVKWGGELVALSTAAEHAAVTGAFSATNATWTGGAGKGSPEGFSWSSGEPWPADAPWAAGQPDSTSDACVELLGDGTLDDTPCEALNSYICERDLSAAP